jgi:hypothetical protein
MSGFNEKPEYIQNAIQHADTDPKAHDFLKQAAAKAHRSRALHRAQDEIRIEDAVATDLQGLDVVVNVSNEEGDVVPESELSEEQIMDTITRQEKAIEKIQPVKSRTHAAPAPSEQYEPMRSTLTLQEMRNKLHAISEDLKKK